MGNTTVNVYLSLKGCSLPSISHEIGDGLWVHDSVYHITSKVSKKLGVVPRCFWLDIDI